MVTQKYAFFKSLAYTICVNFIEHNSYLHEDDFLNGHLETKHIVFKELVIKLLEEKKAKTF